MKKISKKHNHFFFIKRGSEKKLKNRSCPSLTNFTSMAGFFFKKKQYAAIADKELAIKLLNERCLEDVQSVRMFF